MTLRELIDALETELRAGDRVCANGFSSPHSYRGFYAQLAFEPTRNVKISDMLTDARAALGTTYEGYKGGDYLMTDYTECWLAFEGSSDGETIGEYALKYMLRPVGSEEELMTEGRIDMQVQVNATQFVEVIERLAEAFTALGDAFVLAADGLRERDVNTLDDPKSTAARLLGGLE